MTRRQLLALTCGWTSAAASALAQHRMPTPAAAPPAAPIGDADVPLRIGEMTLDLGPRRSVRTLAYNGQVPGPLLRARQGRPLTVDVWNDSRDEDIVHWHGFHIPSDVDGAYEEGTPGVPPNGGRPRHLLTPAAPRRRWGPRHPLAGRDLRASTAS